MRLRTFLVLVAILTATAAFASPAGAASSGTAAASATALACTVADTSTCVPGRTIVRRNQKWMCDRPLARYGRLPIKVVVNFSAGRRLNANGAIDLVTGCAGDGNSNTIDLIVDVR